MTSKDNTIRSAFVKLGEEYASIARFFTGTFGVCGAILSINSGLVIYTNGSNIPLFLLMVFGLFLFATAALLEWKRGRLEQESPDRLHFLVGVAFLTGWIICFFGSITYWIL